MNSNTESNSNNRVLKFYSKKYKEGNVWKFINYLLLSLGSSSLADIKSVTIDKNSLTINYVIGEDALIDLNSAYIKYHPDGKPFAIMGELDWLNLDKMYDPDAIIEACMPFIKK